MGQVLDCLIKKATDGLISQRTLSKLKETIDDVKIGGGSSDELIKAQKAYEVLENRLAQKVRQQEIHMDLLSKASERFKSKAPVNVVLTSFSYPDEANAYRYGYLGPNASEMVLANQRIFKGMATDIFDALSPTKFPKKQAYKDFEASVVKDLYAATRGIGQRSDDPAIRKISDDMMKLTKVGGEAFERAGGNITLRKDYFLGRNVNTEKIIKAGRENFVRDSVMAYDLERVKYATAGIISSIDDLKAAVNKDFDAITSGGISNLAEYAPSGMKSVVNSRNHHRIFSFKDANSDLLWHEKYGNGNIYRRVNDYANSIGRDIGILETYGPKPEAFIRSLLREAATIDPVKASRLKDTTYRQFRNVSGQWDKSLNPTVARYLSNYRGTQTFALLGSTNIDALTSDMLLGMVSRKLRGLPALKGYLRTIKRLASPGIKQHEKQWARMGWYTDGFIDDTLGLLMSAESGGADPLIDSLSRAVLKYSGLTRSTNATKGESVRMLAELLADKEYISSNKAFRAWLNTAGFDDDFLKLIHNHALDKVVDWNVDVANPVKLFEAGYEKEAAKLGTIFNTMSELVSPTTSAQLRGFWSALERGSIPQQLAIGSLKTFTGYTASLWNRNLKVALMQPGALNKAKWISAYATAMIIGGIQATMLRDILMGRDPNLDSSTVMRGLMRSNILLMLGDPLLGKDYSNKEPFDRILGTLAGHAGLGVSAVASLAHGDLKMAGKRTQEALERFLPGRNMWYGNIIQSRLIFDQLNKLYDEEAYNKFKSRSRRADKEGSPFWWSPGELSPERAPNFGNLFEQPFIRPEKTKRSK